MEHYLLAIDQGTTNSRAIIFDQSGKWVSQHEMPLKQFYPHAGWVEQDPEEMYRNIVTCCREVVKKINLPVTSIAALGITNQRETTIIWNRITGKPIYPAIIWQDRRTSEMCQQFSKTNIYQVLQQKTGLLLDPYFSATKIKWILDNVDAVREELLFGTVDTYLLWKLTQGKSHFTDATNASRTLLFNIHTQQWDTDILNAFAIPKMILPTVLDNTAYFGELDQSILGKNIPITAMAGDQQAATVGQACFHPGMIKSTYGTGCFMLLNTGSRVIQSTQKLLSTIAYRINNEVTYGLEGSIFCAGMIVKWLRDTLKIIQSAGETESLASSIPDTGGVYLVPAFTGLGAPYWAPNARAALLGMTLNSGKEIIVRAALESIAYQSVDLLNAMTHDSQIVFETLRVDGGMVANNWFLQYLSDMLHVTVERPRCIETTALGAAFLAGLQIGMYQSLDEISKQWAMKTRFQSQMSAMQRDNLYQGWKQSVKRVI